MRSAAHDDGGWSERLPAEACDCHIHSVGDQSRYPQSPNRSFEGQSVPLSRYFSAADAVGLRRLVLVQPSFYDVDNSCLVDAAAAIGPSRCRGVAAIDENATDDQVDRLHRHGVRGTRFNLQHGRRSSFAAIRRIARHVAPRGWHVELYADGRELPDVWSNLKDLPCDVVLAHTAGIAAPAELDGATVSTLRRWLDGGRCWVKLMPLRVSVAGPPYRDVAPLAELLIGSAAERCLWGSDWPHNNFFSPIPSLSEMLEVMNGWLQSESVKRQILVTNPAALYQFAVA